MREFSVQKKKILCSLTFFFSYLLKISGSQASYSYNPFLLKKFQKGVKCRLPVITLDFKSGFRTNTLILQTVQCYNILRVSQITVLTYGGDMNLSYYLNVPVRFCIHKPIYSGLFFISLTGFTSEVFQRKVYFLYELFL